MTPEEFFTTCFLEEKEPTEEEWLQYVDSLLDEAEKGEVEA